MARTAEVTRQATADKDVCTNHASLSEFRSRTAIFHTAPSRPRQPIRRANPHTARPPFVDPNNRTKWNPLRPPSSSSRSPVSLAVPVRDDPALEAGKERPQTQEKARLGNKKADGIYRLPWWCHPVPCRVHGRPDPLHHPQRQGPWYASLSSASPVKQPPRRATPQLTLVCVAVRENDILCLLESEREARRLR
jgi:hypothetical protein